MTWRVIPANHGPAGSGRPAGSFGRRGSEKIAGPAKFPYGSVLTTSRTGAYIRPVTARRPPLRCDDAPAMLLTDARWASLRQSSETWASPALRFGAGSIRPGLFEK